MIAVGATEFIRKSNGEIIGEQVSGYSNSSPELDVVVPGTALVASPPDPDLFLTSASGTSYASPIVAGSMSLMKQVKPSLTPAQNRSLLIANGDLVKDNRNGQSYPRINVAKTVTALNSVPSTSTTTTAVRPAAQAKCSSQEFGYC